MLPIFDLSSLTTASAAERLALAQRLGETCEKVGFRYFVGHGVSEQTIKRAKAAQEGFFALAEEEKRRLTRPEGIYRGYLPQIAAGFLHAHKIVNLAQLDQRVSSKIGNRA